MYYRVKNYVSLNKTSLTYPAHSICLGQILTNAWSITVAVVITARNGVLVMSVPAPLVMKWILRIRIALVTKWQFLIIHFQFLGRALFTSSVLVVVFSPCQQIVLPLARFWLTRERFCMNRVRSFLSIRCILLGNSLETGPYITVHVVQRAQLWPSVYH